MPEAKPSARYCPLGSLWNMSRRSTVNSFGLSKIRGSLLAAPALQINLAPSGINLPNLSISRRANLQPTKRVGSVSKSLGMLASILLLDFASSNFSGLLT